jgi:pyruvate/2-oxoglutarate dehydrogenase complex dihydrolipoamide dehydrogenase (E3) component
MVLAAIGQQIDPAFPGAESDLKMTDRLTIKTDPLTYETSLPGVFAGGDAASGPATVVEAVGAGHQAAISIARYLAGQDMAADRSTRFKERGSRQASYPPYRNAGRPRGTPHLLVGERIRLS